MQSFRQYRCIDNFVQHGIIQDPEKTFPRGDSQDALDSKPNSNLTQFHERTCLTISRPDSSVNPNLTERTSSVIPVQWDTSDYHLNSRQYSVRRKAAITALVAVIAIAVTASSAIDATGAVEYQGYFGVSDVVASLPTGMSSLPLPLSVTPVNLAMS